MRTLPFVLPQKSQQVLLIIPSCYRRLLPVSSAMRRTRRRFQSQPSGANHSGCAHDLSRGEASIDILEPPKSSRKWDMTLLKSGTCTHFLGYFETLGSPNDSLRTGTSLGPGLDSPGLCSVRCTSHGPHCPETYKGLHVQTVGKSKR